ncbi:MAG: CDP-alcohol phosphatidyltransferase family protein [archaeon]
MLPEVHKKYPSLREKLMKPFLININPNYITVLALFIAFVAAYFIVLGDYLFGGILVLLNGFFDMLDGEIAKAFKRDTKFGDFLDHVFDRIADIVILLALTLTLFVPDTLGYAAIITVLLVSYLGTQAQALTSKRLYSGILGRADRTLFIGAALVVALWLPQALYWAVLIILVLSVVSFIQRFYTITRILKRK